jgi:putative restriction endonuclease
MFNFKEPFTNYICETNISGSGKAKSYVRALDLLCQMLEVRSFGFDDCKNVWLVDSLERLNELYLLVINESRKKDKSEWNIYGLPKSYLQNGYCSAALKCYQGFLVEHIHEQKILRIFNEYNGDEAEVVSKLNEDINIPLFLIKDLDQLKGEEIIRSVKVRSNQNIFRKIILKIYNQSCCITGLDISEVNRASHIIPWSEDENKRLDPRNGLYLSATYDAAFDKNLISLDDEYRIIISKEISDFYTSKSVKEYFISKEGDKITLPSSYFPRKEYLEMHRNKGCF